MAANDESASMQMKENLLYYWIGIVKKCRFENDNAQQDAWKVRASQGGRFEDLPSL